ncbi:hypothetical protein VNO77_04002 [Canavalia gladiata]|uniref:Secreted protein n=1 Tax=Canavalia gladiata TaxID=3824 RepID=A0AAN9R4F9_CANGL
MNMARIGSVVTSGPWAKLLLLNLASSAPSASVDTRVEGTASLHIARSRLIRRGEGCLGVPSALSLTLRGWKKDVPTEVLHKEQDATQHVTKHGVGSCLELVTNCRALWGFHSLHEKDTSLGCSWSDGPSHSASSSSVSNATQRKERPSHREFSGSDSGVETRAGDQNVSGVPCITCNLCIPKKYG